jgi:tRNA A37 N6-isopentenylltransferase MiaA
MDLPKAKPMSDDMRVKHQAASDIGDILTLRKTASFQRYFMRRIKEMKDAAQAAVLEGGSSPAVMTSQRDLDQRDYQLLKRVAELLDSDERANRGIIE